MSIAICLQRVDRVCLKIGLMFWFLSISPTFYHVQNPFSLIIPFRISWFDSGCCAKWVVANFFTNDFWNFRSGLSCSRRWVYDFGHHFWVAAIYCAHLALLPIFLTFVFELNAAISFKVFSHVFFIKVFWLIFQTWGNPERWSPKRVWATGADLTCFKYGTRFCRPDSTDERRRRRLWFQFHFLSSQHTSETCPNEFQNSDT